MSEVLNKYSLPMPLAISFVTRPTQAVILTSAGVVLVLHPSAEAQTGYTGS